MKKPAIEFKDFSFQYRAQAKPTLNNINLTIYKGEKVLIPMNMKDGSIIGIGKGNREWNYSAPHGAGRILSRKQAKEILDIKEYKKSMEGIYTTSISLDTLDEAPQAYKSVEDILDVVGETVDVIEVLKPVYNYKEHGNEKRNY